MHVDQNLPGASAILYRSCQFPFLAYPIHTVTPLSLRSCVPILHVDPPRRYAYNSSRNSGLPMGAVFQVSIV